MKPLGLLVVLETQLLPDRHDVLWSQRGMQSRRRAVVSQCEDKAIVDELVILHRQEIPADLGKVREGAIDAIGNCAVDGDHNAFNEVLVLFGSVRGGLFPVSRLEVILGPAKAALIVENEPEGERRFRGRTTGMDGLDAVRPWKRRLRGGEDVSHGEQCEWVDESREWGEVADDH